MDPNIQNIQDQLLTFVNDTVIPVLMVMASCVFAILAIINGIKYAKAAQEEDKQKAKKNIIGLLIGCAVCVGGVWLMPVLFEALARAFPAGRI